MNLRSIRWRLQLWHGLILLAVLTGFGFTAYQLQYNIELRGVDQQLDQHLRPLLNRLRPPPPNLPPPFGPRGELGPPGLGFDPPGRATGIDSSGASNAFYYVIWYRDGSPMRRSPSAPADLQMPLRNANVALPPTSRQRNMLRELFQFTPPGECILVGRSIAPELANLHQLAGWLLALGGAVLTLGLAGGWLLASRAIRPIADISAAASVIASGDLSRRINTQDTDTELGRLAALLNTTFARLEAAFTQQRRFTSDASHELRTPVSVILTQTQAALSRERPAGELRESLQACQRAAQRMRRLIESLLTLTRLDAGQEPITGEELDLGNLVQDGLDLLQPLAQERQIQIQTDLMSAPCRGDADQMAQVIANLVTNAIVHNRTGGQVRITTYAESGFAWLRVVDNGPGIAVQDLPHVFERFFRADKSRSATGGGSGLGLAISKGIIDAHSGVLEVQSEPFVETCFTVRLTSESQQAGRQSVR
jgi:two-component system OmpR family sensor kinase